jgi:predicted GNAT superfamily acetyltransferase
MVPDDAVVVRPVGSMAEFAACEELSREIWGTAGRNVVPRELLLTMQRNGGVVLGAFDGGGELCGFVFGFVGLRDGQLRLSSHQLAVRPQYRGSGLGQRLKWAQRDATLSRGIDLIGWTFDPLEARNAYLNLHRLGAIARHYSRDHYGTMDDALNAGLSTDRLEAEWWLREARAQARLAGRVPPRSVAEVLRSGGIALLRSEPRGDSPPGPRLVDRAEAGRPAVVAVPRDFQELKRHDLALAVEWRAASRAALENALEVGLVASDFLSDGAYLLEDRRTCLSTA